MDIRRPRAAYWQLKKGTGADGTVHPREGLAIFDECCRIDGCRTGDDIVAIDGNLKARHRSGWKAIYALIFGAV